MKNRRKKNLGSASGRRGGCVLEFATPAARNRWLEKHVTGQSRDCPVTVTLYEIEIKKEREKESGFGLHSSFFPKAGKS